MALPPLLAYMVLMSTPASKAKTRKRDIDKRIGAAMSFISAMASADVNVDVIFKELSRQSIYGEIKNEAEWITRDTELLGIDILTFAYPFGAKDAAVMDYARFAGYIAAMGAEGYTDKQGDWNLYNLQRVEFKGSETPETFSRFLTWHEPVE